MRWLRTWSRSRRDRRHDALVSALRTAVAGGDAGAATALLAPGVLCVVDDGDARPAVTGAGAAASTLISTLGAPALVSVNGRAGLLGGVDGARAVASVSVRRGRIDRVWITTDPRRLTQWI